MELKHFKNEDGSVHEKEKIGFIWARIKILIYNEIKHVGVLLWIIIYTDFKQAVLNAKGRGKELDLFW